MKARVEKVFGHLDPKPEALLLANSVDPHLDGSFFYLFDVPSGLFEGSVAVAYPDGNLDVLSSPLEATSAHLAAKTDRHLTVHVPTSREESDATLHKLLDSKASVGMNYQELTHQQFLRFEEMFPSVRWVDASRAIKRARVTKDAEELGRLQKAADIGSVVAREIPGMLEENMTELALATEMNYRMMKHGASGPSFSTIVGFGPNGAEPHYFAGGRKLQSGDSMVCDFGAFYRRYASDITRSFHFGKRDDEMKRVHELVEEAQQAALAVLRPGVPGKDVHNAAAKVIDASPYKGKFMHGLGHSIGLNVHDGWGMNQLVEEPIEEGMAITIEPGIYLSGHGGVRIEDDVVVTKDGYRFLTTAPRGYLEVSA